MQAEIVAIGTELLLGQVVDTNSSWIATELATAGIDCLYQSRVGDNLDRIVAVLEAALSRNDAVITCGGLGPTQDDITREAIARVMGVRLVLDDSLRRRVEDLFRARGRTMSANNLRQAELPEGALPITQVVGSAPGLVCPVGTKVIYAVPGVPHEMREMVSRAVIPDLAKRGGEVATIRSRTLRTFGVAESTIAEIVAPRVDALDALGTAAPTIAFLASGIEGVKVRVSVKAPSARDAVEALDREEAALRALLGDCVFGIDDETMEHALAMVLLARGLRLAVAESLTGGMISSRLVAVPGASEWFLGGVVSYASAVKHDILGVPPGPVVTGEAAMAMAEGVRDRLGADVAVATTGVAGPTEQEGKPPGTVYLGLALPGGVREERSLRIAGDRSRVRELAVLQALGTLRARLLAS